MTQALLKLNARTFASLRKHRNYRLFFTGQVVSLAGTWMQNIEARSRRQQPPNPARRTSAGRSGSST